MTQRQTLSEEAVKTLPTPIAGNRVTYFAGDKLQGKVAPAGFGVRVTAGGSRAFVLNYRINGRERRYTIGEWKGTRGAWSVIAAVDEAMKLRKQIDKGHDPQETKEQSRAPAVVGKTVSDLLDDFVERYAEKDRKLRSADGIKRALERLVKPRIGETGIYELKRSAIVEMLDEIADENGPVMADRTLAYVRKAFNWYMARDEDFKSPIVKGLAKTRPSERARERTLTDEEIRDVWAGLDLVAEPACYARYVRTLFVTMTRRSEASAMGWPELESDLWTIPGERYKTGVDHVIPLSATAVKIIGERPKDPKKAPYVFSTTGGDVPFSGYSKAKALLEKKIAELRKKDGREPMANWTLHDLRRTGRSLMSRAGVPADIAERCLGHVIPGVRGVYDRYGYLAEKRDAFDKLAAVIERILNPPAKNVASFDEERSKRVAELGAA